MRKCVYKEIADKLDKVELEKYYSEHLKSDTCKHFGFDEIYFYRIFDYLGIKRRTPSENTKFIMSHLEDNSRCIKSGLTQRGKYVSPETKEKIRQGNLGRKGKPTPTSFKKGSVPWNKGLKDVQHWSDEQKKKYAESMRKSGWFKNKTKIEIEIHNMLNERFGEENVIYQYKDEERYPFFCDFYVKSKDLFIEVNNYWTHNTHPYNSNDEKDNLQVKDWEEKAKIKPQYKTALDVWTKRDVLKFQTAKENNLNYIAIYTLQEFKDIYSISLAV